MELRELIEKRRALRSLERVEITEDMIKKMTEAAILAPSCFNNQPWRFVFVTEEDKLKAVFGGLSKGNEWMQAASAVVAVFTQKEIDCVVKGREYYLFDTGMATAYMMLMATDMGLVFHPIAGFHEDRIKEVLDIPAAMTLITLAAIGKATGTIGELLTEKQALSEDQRPERLPLEKVLFFNKFQE